MSATAALLEGDAHSPRRRAAAGAAAGREVRDSALSLERATVETLLRRLQQLKRELQGAIVAAGGNGFRAFTAASLITEIDQLIAHTTSDLTGGAARAVLNQALELGAAEVDQTISGASVSISAAPQLDHVLVTHAFDAQAELLTQAMQKFRNQVVAGVRRAAVSGASSFDEIRALAGSIEAAGFAAAAFNAERIVRTELGRVLNGSTYDRMADLATSLPFIRKGWRSAKDSRTRKGHVEAANTYARGSGIPVDQPFRVNVYREFPGKPAGALIGTASLRFPIDPLAEPAGRIAAGATIMCRCGAFVDFDLSDLAEFSASRTTMPTHTPTMARGGLL